MMTKHTKRTMDAAVDELKRNGYMVLVVMLDTKAEETKNLGAAVEVMCSETNDPKILAEMLKTTIGCLTQEPTSERKVLVH